MIVPMAVKDDMSCFVEKQMESVKFKEVEGQTGYCCSIWYETEAREERAFVVQFGLVFEAKQRI